MVGIEELATVIEPILSKHDCQLYECKWINQKRSRILQIAITKTNGSVDIDTCANVSSDVSEILDEQFSIDFEYMLEVCSAGAERQLRSKNEVLAAVGKHIFVKLNKQIKGHEDFTGDLLSFEEDVIEMTYRDKALTKNVKFNYSDINLIRLAVKF